MFAARASKEPKDIANSQKTPCIIVHYDDLFKHRQNLKLASGILTD